MATRASFLLVALTVVFVGCGNGEPASSPNLDGIHDQAILEQASYLFGYQMGDAARAQMDSTVIADLDMDIMLAAVREGLSGDSLRYEPLALRRVTRVIDDTLLLRSLRREAAEAMITQEFFDEVMEGILILERGARNGAIGDTLQISNGDFIHVMVTDTLLLSNGLSFSEMRRQLAPGKFLDEIATNTAATDSFFTSLEGTEGLQTTDSGLRYVVLQEGEGEPPTEGERTMVMISTSLMGGQELRGMTTPPDEPVELILGNFAVEGLNEALKDMAPGESRRLFIPPSLAFGLGGLPAPGDDRVPPATAIILEVALTDILDPIDISSFGIGTAPPAIPQEAEPATQ